MKKELIKLGFACLLTAQLDQILNIDKSEVSTDGIGKLCDGYLVTGYYSCDKKVSSGLAC